MTTKAAYLKGMWLFIYNNVDLNIIFNKIRRVGRELKCLYTRVSILETGTGLGGNSIFTADGVTSQFDILHNLGEVPSYFSITTTEPIASNHLNRVITFPNSNTMRITFGFPPSIGENANYIWIVYK